ncbi:MAG: exosortase-associated EpsI family protein [Thermoplasmatota archaeon]
MKLPYRGGAISLLLFLVLATPPAELLETAGAYADVRGDIRSTAATPIEVQAGLSKAPAEAIPRQLGQWNGTDDDTWPEELETSLRYDSLLVRQYTRPGFYQPVQLMVITAEHAGAFHNPSVCFRAQGNRVLAIEDTAIQVDDQEHAVGRMIADKDDQPSRLVYNLYLVEQKFAAPERTTWLRLIYYGANETTAPQVEPFMVDLMSQIAPHAFAGRDGERTTFQALSNGFGMGWAITAAVGAILPVAIDAVLRRKSP